MSAKLNDKESENMQLIKDLNLLREKFRLRSELVNDKGAVFEKESDEGNDSLLADARNRWNKIESSQ